MYNGSFVDGGWDGEGVWHGIFPFIQTLFIPFQRRLRIISVFLNSGQAGEIYTGGFKQGRYPI